MYVYEEITDISTDLFTVRRGLADRRQELVCASILIVELVAPSSSSPTPTTLHPRLDPTLNPRLNPIPYSSTIQILELNYELHRDYLQRRVTEANSNLDLVYDNHHFLDVTVNHPLNHHDFLYDHHNIF